MRGQLLKFGYFLDKGNCTINYQQLTEQERYQIYILLKAGFNNKAIADQLGRHPSTISRETKRNRGLKGYRPAQAQIFTEQRRQEANKYWRF